MNRFNKFAIILLATLGLSAGGAAFAAGPGGKQGVVMQVSDNDPAKWNLALNNAKNVQSELGKDKVDIEIVAYGPGINMLKMESEVGNRLEDAKKNGIKVVACQNTMKAQKLTEKDMHSAIGYVPSGVVELMKKQEAGYAYIHP